MIYHTTDQQSAIEEIALRINQALQQGSVLWLVSGGSNIGTATAIRREITITNSLAVGLIDERHGAVGHANSNWQQLFEAGFDFNDLSPLPILTGLDIGAETQRYNKVLEQAFTDYDTVIGLFGMGSDGHTSGLLPQCPVLGNEEMVASYTGPDFERITTTPVAFTYVDTAYLVAFGSNKQNQLQQLVHHRLDISHQPVQALKSTRELIIFTDQVLTEGF